MRKPIKGLLVALYLLSLIPVHAFSLVDPTVGIPGGPDVPEAPYGLDFLVGRTLTFNVKKGSGSLLASGSYVTLFTTNALVSVKGNAIIKDLSSRTWDFQVIYTNGVRMGDYTFKMTAPLSGSFSNVLFATTNAPPVISGVQTGLFYMTEKRLDMNQDLNTEILWQRDDGHLGVWFMKNGINGTIQDTNLNKGIYLDSLYLATGHPSYDPSWRVICQADLDLNGMQDWVWQNTNSGQLRAWFLENTNFVDRSITNYNYHFYSKPVITSDIDPTDFTVTTNLTPTLITNYFTVTETEIITNFLSGPGFDITTIVDGAFLGNTNLLLPPFTTNIVTTPVTNIISFTNNSGTVISLTNIVIATNVFVLPNDYSNLHITNTTTAFISGRPVSFDVVLDIPDINSFTSITLHSELGGGHNADTIFTYTNFPDVFRYYTNSVTKTYAEVLVGFYSVTYTTNYNLTSTTNFVNPFIREYTLDSQSPPDASYRLAAVSDLDNDGFPDFVFRGADGSVFYEGYFEDFADPTTQTNHYLIDPNPDYLNWNLTSVVDLNNDGWPDLLWQKNVAPNNGATSISFMRGTNDLNAGFLYRKLAKNGNGSLNGGAAMPSWRIAGNADFNHDGQMDVLLRNTNTGQLIFWYLSGPKLLKSSTIGGPILPWQIVGPK